MPLSSQRYKLIFQIAAVLAPVVMGLAAALFGDVAPVVQDVCRTLLPAGSYVQVPVAPESPNAVGE